MPPDRSGANDGGSYCSSCGELIPSSGTYCPECGVKRPGETHVAADPAPDPDGFTHWAIGFAPGSTLRNVLVGVAYVVFYFLGIPLLLYAYWNRGGKYRKRAYGLVGALAVGFVAIVVLGAVVGAAVGPVEDADSPRDVDKVSEPTPTPEPVSEYSVRVRYSGSWQGALSVTGGGSSRSESISGSGTESIEITGDVDIVSVNAQKQDDSGAGLTVEIRNDGAVVAEASTSSAYGVAQTSQTF